MKMTVLYGDEMELWISEVIIQSNCYTCTVCVCESRDNGIEDYLTCNELKCCG